MNVFEEDGKVINQRIQQLITVINLKTLIMKISILLIIIFIVLRYMYGFIRMKDNTMEPFISEGQLLLYYRIDKDYKLGDVIVCNHNGKNYVLRIVAKEGQSVTITEDGEILVDGFPETNQSSLYPTSIPENTEITYPYEVAQNSFFVVCDYSVETNDSRMFGAITSDEIKGKVISSLKIRNI